MLYFAYGSNMSTSRLRSRLPNTKPIGIGLLRNYSFTCNKLSKDGTGKGNIQAKEDGETWGVVFEVEEDDLNKLDRIEGGYQRINVRIEQDGKIIEAVTYISYKTANVLPTGEYFAHILKGAIEHGLPGYYIEMLRNIETV